MSQQETHQSVNDDIDFGLATRELMVLAYIHLNEHQQARLHDIIRVASVDDAIKYLATASSELDKKSIQAALADVGGFRTDPASAPTDLRPENEEVTE